MLMIKEFFENVDFSFGSKDADIKPNEIIISENEQLTNKLQNRTFVYDSSENTNNSFYVITIPLSDEELFEVRRYIWNEDKYDLYFVYEKTNFLTLCYAKNNPKNKSIKIASFKGDEKDNKELDKIRKWKFQSGAFWISYVDFLENIKKSERVDKKLIDTLKELKKKLIEELDGHKNIDEILQALIDRTLFIKFLEDNHIINSFFYNYYFPEKKELSYKKLLQEQDIKNINLLFEKINAIFNNVLFQTPQISEKYLTDNILNLLYNAIRQYDWKTGQLSLFDFRFDVIPIEFVSHIYEVFLEGKQLYEGIYYTPIKLAQLIIDDTITKQGTVLDPACGSGMFLVLAFRKLLEIIPPKSDTNISENIEYKNKILKDFIFGIEKENTAWRLTIFSLYLEILKGLPAEEIKEFIRQKIEKENKIKIFSYDFSENIINANSLEIEPEELPHKDKTFDYIVGNPPYFQIKINDIEKSFINNYTIEIENKTFKATDVVGYNQISQAFMLKIKDWVKNETKFGFILNSSNFYNEKSEKFQKFFFEYYQIENFYELSRVKKILFRKAKESVVIAIFNNRKVENNTINYYTVDLGIFSETFNLLIIQEDKKIEIKQKDIFDKKIKLRNYLIGNEFDLKLLNKLSDNSKVSDYLSTDKRYSSFRGLTRISDEKIRLYFNLTDSEFKNLSKNEKIKLHEKFAKDNYLSLIKSDYYNTPYIYQPGNKIKAFGIIGFDGFMNEKGVNKNNFQRPRNIFIYKGENIIFNRFGKRIEAAYKSGNLFFSSLIYGLKLQEDNLYPLFTAILNSVLVNYYLSLKHRKRIDDNFANLDTEAIKNIPIPKEFDENLIIEITEISKILSENKLKYDGKTKEKLNELIFDLYKLDILEKTRIKDFFTERRKVTDKDLEEYKISMNDILEFYFENKPIINYYQCENLPFGLVIITIYFNKAKSNQPTAKKTLQYVINEILKNTDEKFLAMREKVFGNDCINIIKNNQYQNWTTTKAFEDGQEILKRLKR